MRIWQKRCWHWEVGTAYNRYQGNTGRVIRVPDAEPEQQHTAAPDSRETPSRQSQTRPGAGQAKNARIPGERRPPSPLSGLSGELDRLVHRLSPAKLETEDFLLIFIFYLLYRESGDEEFLFAIGGLLLF